MDVRFSNFCLTCDLFAEVDHGVLALSSKMRKHIALGVAKGLAYLHEECSPNIVHRNVKSGVVLLDDEYEALVAGFQFHEVIDFALMSRMGTQGYEATEDYGVASVKDDVYNYGIVLLELITARNPLWVVKGSSEYKRVVNLIDWVSCSNSHVVLPN